MKITKSSLPIKEINLKKMCSFKSASKSFSQADGETITLSEIHLGTNNGGDNVCYVVNEKGEVYAGTSNSIYSTLEMILDSGEFVPNDLKVKVVSQKSSTDSKKTYYDLEIL